MTASKVRAAFILTTMILVSQAWAYNRTCRLAIENAKGKKIIASVEIADKDDTRQRGLMFRRILDADEGMLFVFSGETIQHFWMKNTYIPLSIAYIDKRGVINEIYEMKPLDTSVTYPSKKPAMYALEMNSGWFERNDIKTGCRINLHGCIGKQDPVLPR